jgi:hypothetical protein
MHFFVMTSHWNAGNIIKQNNPTKEERTYQAMKPNLLFWQYEAAHSTGPFSLLRKDSRLKSLKTAPFASQLQMSPTFFARKDSVPCMYYIFHSNLMLTNIFKWCLMTLSIAEIT